MSYTIVPVNEIPKAQPVPHDDLTKLYKYFFYMEMICNEFYGIGLHAVQIGLPLDMYVIKRDSKFEYYLNCVYEPVRDEDPLPGPEKVLSIEGCLSLVNSDGSSRYFAVNRYKRIVVHGASLCAHKLELRPVHMYLGEGDGVYCMAHQHEISHGSGTLISQIGQEIYIRKVSYVKSTTTSKYLSSACWGPSSM